MMDDFESSINELSKDVEIRQQQLYSLPEPTQSWRIWEWINKEDSADHEYELKPMNILPGCVTVTGISGGSFMAMQLHLIFSDWIKGVGLLLGGAFGTAESLETIHTKNDDDLLWRDDISDNFLKDKTLKKTKY